MSRAKRMQVVLQLVEQAEKSAATLLAQARQAVAVGVSQQRQLENYANEYSRRLNDNRQPQNAFSLVNDREFLNRLSDACDVQRQQVGELEAKEAESLSQWQTAHRRRKALEELIERLSREDDEVAEKRLQKELDDLANLSRRPF